MKTCLRLVDTTPAKCHYLSCQASRRCCANDKPNFKWKPSAGPNPAKTKKRGKK